MFGQKNTFKTLCAGLCRPGLLSAFLCIFVTYSVAYAQQNPEGSGAPPPGHDPADTRYVDKLGEHKTDEWEMDIALANEPSVLSNGTEIVSLPDEAQDQQLQQLLSELAAHPDSTGILGQLNTLLADVLRQAGEFMDAGSVVEAERLLAAIQPIDPSLEGLKAAQSRLQLLHEAEVLLAAGNAAMDEQRIIEPENDNAFYYYSQALAKDPQNLTLQPSLVRVQEALVERAIDSARGLDFEMAGYWLEQASAIREDQSLVDEAWEQLVVLQNMRAEDLEKKTIEAIEVGDFNLAEFTIIDLIAMGGQEERIQTLRARLEDTRYYGGFEPGQIIADSFLQSTDKAPDVVVIAAGSFRMGSNGASDNEKPKHRVTIKHGFGMGAKEVSVSEFRLFIERSGYRTAAVKNGSSPIYDEPAGRLSSRDGIDWQRAYDGKKAKPDMPVLHVNWHDAQAYVQWLSRETGQRYRLPTEAEYEYVARANGSGAYWWGEGSPSEVVENLTGEHDSSPSNRYWTTSFEKYGDNHWGPAATGSLQSSKLIHAMGVHDIAGNVREWIEDCWHQNYMQAPSDGSAWVNPGCSRRVVRGGYWASAPEQSRATFRNSAKPDTTGPTVGIRIARDL